MQKIRMPSFQTIFDTAISEIIVNGIWYVVSELASIHSSVRDWGFLVLSVVVVIIVGWYLGKRTSPKQEKGQPVPEPTPPPIVWLADVLEEDRDLLKKIYLTDYYSTFSGIRQTDPYIEVTFKLINAAVFPILINGINDRMWINGQECGWLTEYLGVARIPHGDYTNVRIKQHLSKEMAALIIGDGKSLVNIKLTLTNCTLTIKPEIPGENPHPWNIYIGKDFSVQWNPMSIESPRMEHII